MTFENAPTSIVERLHVDHIATKRLGNWTSANSFEIRARSGSLVLDLRSPNIVGEVEIQVDLDRAMLKLLLADDDVIEHWDLTWTAKGKIKDGQRPAAATGRRISLAGAAHDSEIRVHRGGVALVSAMLSREYVQDLRRAHKAGEFPTVDDPTRTAG